MQLTPFCLTLSCLQLSPDRSQFFRYESFSLSCESHDYSTIGWKVKKKLFVGNIKPCSTMGSTVSSTVGSTCTISTAYPVDSAVYFCQSTDGQSSNGVNITVTDRTVLLEIPALPVLEGAAVTLRCRDEFNPSSSTFSFYRDGSKVHSSSDGQITFAHTSKSDEGLYKCSNAGGEESVSSWLNVQAALPTSSSAPHPPVSPPASLCVFRLLCHLVVAAPYLLSTVLLAFIYRDKMAGKKKRQHHHKRKSLNSKV